MRIAIHQPEHMPWGGFFHKMAAVDLYVVLDCVQYTKNNWQNRNLFSTPRSENFWLTVPVKIKGHLDKSIRDIEIAYSTKWLDKYLKTLDLNYARTPFWSCYRGKINSIFESKPTFLWQLNIELIHFLRESLGICNELIFASDLNPTGCKTELLLDICKKVGATTYVSGSGGKQYLDLNLFSENEINVEFDHYCPNENILPKSLGLSFSHTLFHLGEESKNFINNKQTEAFSHDAK